MNIDNINMFKNVCVWGLGKRFDGAFEKISSRIRIDFLTDSSDPVLSKTKNVFPTISIEETLRLQHAFFIITTSFEDFEEISKFLSNKGVAHCWYNEIQGIDWPYPAVDLSKLTENYIDHLGNRIEIGPHVKFKKQSYVFFGRDDGAGIPNGARENYVSFEFACSIEKVKIEFLSDRSIVKIGGRCWVRNLSIIVARNNTFEMGFNVTCEDLFAFLHEGGRIQIGTGCMISHRVELWQNDGHPIFDIDTGARINKSRDIIIDDHVWVGTKVTLMGGAHVGEGSIIGANCCTSGKFSGKSVIVGNPARIIRSNVVWTNDETRNEQIETIYDTRLYSKSHVSDVILLGDEVIKANDWSACLLGILFENFGNAGATTYDILRNIHSITYAKPKYVFLMIGLTDFALFHASDKKSDKDNDKIIKNSTRVFSRYRLIIEKLMAYNINVVAHTVPEIDVGQYQFFRQSIKNYNASITNYCSVEKIPLIDINKIAVINSLKIGSYEVDRFKLNIDVYGKWAMEIKKYINELS